MADTEQQIHLARRIPTTPDSTSQSFIPKSDSPNNYNNITSTAVPQVVNTIECCLLLHLVWLELTQTNDHENFFFSYVIYSYEFSLKAMLDDDELSFIYNFILRWDLFEYESNISIDMFFALFRISRTYEYI
jgi:high-affinity nickel permease